MENFLLPFFKEKPLATLTNAICLICVLCRLCNGPCARILSAAAKLASSFGYSSTKEKAMLIISSILSIPWNSGLLRTCVLKLLYLARC